MTLLHFEPDFDVEMPVIFFIRPELQLFLTDDFLSKIVNLEKFVN